MIKKISNVNLEEKWEKCLDCKYNHNGKEDNLKRGDFQLFNCFANVNEFPCDRIPELYPEKIVEKLNLEMSDGKIIKSKDGLELKVYSLEFYDKINDNITRVIVASDSKSKIEEHFKEIVSKKVYSHLLLYKIEELENIFKNYTVLLIPNEVNKVVFPELNIDLDHYGKSINMKELTYSIDRYPGINEDSCRSSNIKIDQKLSIGIHDGRIRKQKNKKS